MLKFSSEVIFEVVNTADAAEKMGYRLIGLIRRLVKLLQRKNIALV